MSFVSAWKFLPKHPVKEPRMLLYGIALLRSEGEHDRLILPKPELPVPVDLVVGPGQVHRLLERQS